MSVDGIGGGFGAAGLVPERTRLDRPAESQPNAPRPTEPATSAEPSRPDVVVPHEAPAGIDPELWAVLSTDERAFFARARSLGPLTYGPGAPRRTDIPAALQGGRIDVKV